MTGLIALGTSGLRGLHDFLEASHPVELTLDEFSKSPNHPVWVRLSRFHADATRAIPVEKGKNGETSRVLIPLLLPNDTTVGPVAFLLCPPDEVPLNEHLHSPKVEGTLLNWLGRHSGINDAINSVIGKQKGDTREVPVIEEGQRPGWVGSSILVILATGGLALLVLDVVLRRRAASKRAASLEETARRHREENLAEWINLTPLLTAIEQRRLTIWTMWVASFVLFLASMLFAMNLVWTGAWVAGSLSVVALSAALGLTLGKWGWAFPGLVLIVLCAVVGVVILSIIAGRTFLLQDSSAAIGLALVVALGCGFVGQLVQGLGSAGFFYQAPLGREYCKALGAARSRKARSANARWDWRRPVGWVLFAVALISFAMHIMRAFQDLAGQKDIYPLLAGDPVSLWIALILWVVSIFLLRLARRRTAARAGESMMADQRPPVLFLRSFGDDDARIALPRLSTVETLFAMRDLFVPVRGARFEECLTELLTRQGPVIAIGKPGEALPLLGASREYFADSEWQAAISDWMLRCALIVMAVGRTGGVGWEFAELKRLGVEDKLLLIFPSEPTHARVARWKAFCVHCFPALPETLTGLHPESVILIRHRSGKSPQVIASSQENYHAYEAALHLALVD